MKRKITAIILMVVLVLALAIPMATPVVAAKGATLKPPNGLHWDVNFVTEGKIAFQSTFDGTTTPTVPPFYWHDDFESGLGKWSQVVGSAGTIATVDDKGRGIPASTAVEVYQTSDSGDTVLYGSIYAPAAGQGRAIFWFYDDITVTGTQVVDVLEDTASLLYGGKALLIGINGGSSSKYVSRVYPSGGGSDTSSARSTGWHEIEFIADGSTVIGKIDGTPVASTSTFGNFNFIEIGSYWSVSGPGLYYDDVTVLGPTGLGQSWVGDGPNYTETRTTSGTVTGPVISGNMTISGTTTLDVTTGSGMTIGTWTLTNGPDGFAGTLTATNTNFGLLSGSFVSTSATGIYAGQTVEGTFTGNFYESAPGVSGWDSFTATLTGVPDPNEILIPLNGMGYVQWTFGPDFQIVDSDAGVFDEDKAIVQFPWQMDMYVWWLSARGKPSKIGVNDITGDGHTTWLRNTGAPTWTQWPGKYSWTGGVNGHTASLNNNGVTNLALRVYPNQ